MGRGLSGTVGVQTGELKPFGVPFVASGPILVGFLECAAESYQFRHEFEDGLRREQANGRRLGTRVFRFRLKTAP
jgi:hypothetical protein